MIKHREKIYEVLKGESEYISAATIARAKYGESFVKSCHASVPSISIAAVVATLRTIAFVHSFSLLSGPYDPSFKGLTASIGSLCPITSSANERNWYSLKDD